MAKLSKFQAVKMGSDHFLCLRAAQNETREGAARALRQQAETYKAALMMNGWRILPDGINVERVK